jgi:hypothetical protein
MRRIHSKNTLARMPADQGKDGIFIMPQTGLLGKNLNLG